MSSSNVVGAWSGDNTTIEVKFYRDKERETPRTFASDATVNWRIVSEDGLTLVQTFTGSVKTGALDTLTGTMTAGAPAAGKYRLYAEVTEGANTETIPDPLSPLLTLVVKADPVP